MKTDWQALKNEYIQATLSLKDLGAKHGVALNQLQRRSAAEGWVPLRKAWRLIAAAPALPPEAKPSQADAAADAGPDDIARLQSIRKQLTDQLARATGELDKHILVHKCRRKEIAYDDSQGRGKPAEETTEEREQLEVVDALVDCLGLQRLSAALKILREVAQADAGDATGTDRVAELMKRLDGEAAVSGKD